MINIILIGLDVKARIIPENLNVTFELIVENGKSWRVGLVHSVSKKFGYNKTNIRWALKQLKKPYERKIDTLLTKIFACVEIGGYLFEPEDQ